MAKFLHIAFNFESRPAKQKVLIPVFDLALDWVRYAPNCWIVYTTSNPKKWYERLKPRLHNADGIFICELNLSERSGWLPQSVWDWIGKNRNK